MTDFYCGLFNTRQTGHRGKQHLLVQRGMKTLINCSWPFTAQLGTANNKTSVDAGLTSFSVLPVRTKSCNIFALMMKM